LKGYCTTSFKGILARVPILAQFNSTVCYRTNLTELEVQFQANCFYSKSSKNIKTITFESEYLNISTLRREGNTELANILVSKPGHFL
jgi:hypothetical protein